jgi:hypothetical protein
VTIARYSDGSPKSSAFVLLVRCPTMPLPRIAGRRLRMLVVVLRSPIGRLVRRFVAKQLAKPIATLDLEAEGNPPPYEPAPWP